MPKIDHDAPAVELPHFALRLRELLAHLDLSQRAFAARINVDPTTINRVWNGERSAAEKSAKITLGAQRVFQLDPRYWDEEGPPEDFRRATGAGNLSTPAMAPASLLRDHEDPRFTIAQASAEAGEPAAIQQALLLLKPPPGGDVWGWYVRQYIRIRDEHQK